MKTSNMNKPEFPVLLLVLLIIAVIILISGCAKEEQKQEPADSSPIEPAKIIKGVSLSPKSFQQNDFTGFFEKAKQAGSIVTWAGDWKELSYMQNGGPKVVAELSTVYNYIPIIEAQFFTQSSGKLLRPLDESTKQMYKKSAVDFAEKYKPKYLGLGIEVNALYEQSPEDFEQFVSLFDDVYDAVKARSPDTKIFTIFQLEKMKGLNGGLFGGTNDPVKAQWKLLNRFTKADVIAFTTYPGLIYKEPSEIPPSYYDEIKTHTSKPIAFTEIGWHSDASPAGWESSEGEQAKFITAFFALSKGINADFFIWSFMYDQNTIEPFKSMGLRNNDGTVKSAWDEWIAVR